MWALEETSHWQFLAEKLLGRREKQRKNDISDESFLLVKRNSASGVRAKEDFVLSVAIPIRLIAHSLFRY